MARGRSKKDPGAAELAGMPQPFELRHEMVGSTVVVSYGGSGLAVYDAADRGIRNLTLGAPTRAGRRGVGVAGLFGVRPARGRQLRRTADEGGAAALVPTRGRPVKLTPALLARVYAMADEGMLGTDIATALGVSAATISRRLSERPQSAAEELDLTDIAASDDDTSDDDDTETPTDTTDDDTSDDTDETTEVGDDRGPTIEKIASGERDCAYAGAMLLHGFYEHAGAGAVLGALPSC